MSFGHDVNKHLEYIKQALSQSKRPLSFFIGAGCPLSVRVNLRDNDGKQISDPLLPDVAGLTFLIDEQMKKSQPTSWTNILNVLKEDSIDTGNIENILTRIRALLNVAGHGTVRGFVADDLNKLDLEICKIIANEVNKELPVTTSPYHNLAIWARSYERNMPIHIFTTNYDLLIEQAFEESSAPYFDGFIGSRKAFFDLGAVEREEILPARWSRLWKIHGSLNWHMDENPNKSKIVYRSDQVSEASRHLIYPSHLKYDESRKMPYLAMLDRLKYFLMKPSSLMFINGYSFSDDHINDIITSGLDSNSSATVFAFLYGSLNDSKYSKAISIAENTHNLSIMAFDEAIIGRNRQKYQYSERPTLINYDKFVDLIDGGKNHCKLRLGDFAIFGALLKELSGISDEEK